MIRMKLLAVVLLGATCAAGVLVAQQGSRESVRKFMRPKLEHSQKLLEGLTLEDYDAIKTEAQALSLLSLEVEWNVLQTEDYLHFSNEFRRAANATRDAAEKKNLDGATLAYLDMTMKCIRCHKYVRDVKLTNRPGSAKAK